MLLSQFLEYKPTSTYSPNKIKALKKRGLSISSDGKRLYTDPSLKETMTNNTYNKLEKLETKNFIKMGRKLEAEGKKGKNPTETVRLREKYWDTHRRTSIDTELTPTHFKPESKPKLTSAAASSKTTPAKQIRKGMGRKRMIGAGIAGAGLLGYGAYKLNQRRKTRSDKGKTRRR